MALGATPTAMPGSEVYQALAVGIVDGAITDVAAAVSRKYYEVQDAFTVVSLLVAVLVYRNFGLRDLRACACGTMLTSMMVFMIIAGAAMFAHAAP